MTRRGFRIVHEGVVTPYPTMPVTRPRWYSVWARHHAALKIPAIMHSYQMAVESLRIEFVEGGISTNSLVAVPQSSPCLFSIQKVVFNPLAMFFRILALQPYVLLLKNNGG